VIDAGLDMFLAAWETVLAGKVATKLLGMSAQEVKDTVAAVQKRAAKVRALLREGHETLSGDDAGVKEPQENRS
jgi:hypothetical protein